MPTEKEILQYIERGSLVLALQSVKNSDKLAQERVDSSYRALKAVYTLCYKNNKGSVKCSSTDADNLCELTTVLCQNISYSWKCNRLTFMQCLYHINSYLVKHNPLHGRKVSEFFFHLKRSSWDGTWDPDESLVVANLVHDFFSQITDRFLEILSSDGENSFSSWLNFIFRLSELSDFKKLYKLFSVLDSIWVKAYHQCIDKLGDCIGQCLTQMGQWANRLTLSDRKIETTEKDVACLFNLIDRMVKISKMNGFSSLSEAFEYCAVAFKKLLPHCDEDMSILADCFKFFANIEKPSVVVNHFDKTFSSVMKRKSKKSAALPILAVLMFKFRDSMLSCSVLLESRVSSIAKLLTELVTYSQKDSDAPSRRAKMVTDLSYCVLSIIASPTVQKDCLVSEFPMVKTFVKQFIKVIPDTDNKSNISVGVSAILNVMLAFKKVEQFEEPVWLCRYVLFIFLKIEPNVLWEDYCYKSYVDTWLRLTVAAYAKCNLGVEAQVMMIVFAAYQPKYTISAMRAWARMKCFRVQSIMMDATVLDVMSVNRDEIEKQFPHFNLADVNQDLLLLGEIYGYTKQRDLRNDPVLIVYKTAAKTVKDYITLANILCCTVEAFSLSRSDTEHISKLDVSLSNMIKHLQKLEGNGRECEHDPSVVLCTIGNLYYHMARLEIQRTRQKSEAEVAQSEKWHSKKKIPVFRAGGKDDLDMTEVDLVGTTCKLIQKSDVFSLLTNALNYWSLGEKSVAANLVLVPTLSFMKGAGYVTRLHRYKELETTCWTLLVKIASKLDSFKYQMLGAAELLFSCRSVESSIIREMEMIMDNPKRIDRKCYVYHLYRISCARNLLLCGKVDESRQALKKVDSQAVLPFFLVNAQLTILKTFLDFERPKDETPLLPIVKLFENILYLIKNNEWETFNEACVQQCLMIDVCTSLGTIYSDMKCVRLARLYTKAELTIAQRLALPVRVCELMTLKCWVDLLTWNVTDSDLNAQEVENMLELGVLKSEAQPKSDSDPLQRSAIKCVPHFLSRKDCKCYYCVDVDYPSLALNAIINRVLILIGNGVRLEAQNVINVGLSVVEIVQQKDQSCNSLWTPFSSSVARFYYVVARTKVLWKKYKEGVHFATLAYKMLQSESVKNYGLISSSKQLLLETKYVQNYKEPPRIVPVSRRFGVHLQDDRCITPEAQVYKDSKPWDSTVNDRKTAAKFYLTHRKSLFNKHLNFCHSEADENGKAEVVDCVALGELTPMSSEVGTANGKIHSEKKREIPSVVVTDTQKSVGVKRLEEVDVDSRFVEEHKLQLGVAALKLNDGDGVTPVAKRTGRQAPLIGSTRKPQTERKVRLPKVNLFNAASISSLTKMTSTTPAIKVFYDPEGLEHSASVAKKNKTKEGAGRKRTTRLAALSKAVKDEKFGTPIASKAVRTAKGKLTFDEGSDDELELVVAAPRKNQKKNGMGSKCIKDCDETDAASEVNEKSRGRLASEIECSARTGPVVIDDADDKESVTAPFRKVLNRQRSDNNGLTKRFIHDKTTLLEESSVNLKEERLNKSVEIASNPELFASEQSNMYESEDDQEPIAAPFRKILDTERKVYSRRLIHDETTLTEQSIPVVLAKDKKKNPVPAISKPKSASESNLDVSEDDTEPIAAPFRKILDTDRKVYSRRLIHDETTLSEQSIPVVLAKDKKKIPIPAISKPKSASESNLDVSEDDTEPIAAPFRKILDTDRKVYSRRLIHDETTLTEQSISVVLAKDKKKIPIPAISKPKSASESNLDVSEDDMEPIAAPFRKLLNADGCESVVPSRRLIHDETTIVDQTLKQSYCDDFIDDQESVAAPYRKLLGSKGNERAGSSLQLIQDDTTLGNQALSPDLIDSSVVEITLPKSGRRCVALTPLGIEDQMGKLTLATRSTKKRAPPSTIPKITPIQKDVANGKTRAPSSNTTKESSSSLAKKGTSRPLRSAVKRLN